VAALGRCRRRRWRRRLSGRHVRFVRNRMACSCEDFSVIHCPSVVRPRLSSSSSSSSRFASVIVVTTVTAVTAPGASSTYEFLPHQHFSAYDWNPSPPALQVTYRFIYCRRFRLPPPPRQFSCVMRRKCIFFRTSTAASYCTYYYLILWGSIYFYRITLINHLYRKNFLEKM